MGVAVEVNRTAGYFKAGPAARENDVRVQIVVAKTGHAMEPRVLNRVEMREETGVRQAMTSWLFAPATREGKTVATRFELTLER